MRVKTTQDHLICVKHNNNNKNGPMKIQEFHHFDSQTFKQQLCKEVTVLESQPKHLSVFVLSVLENRHKQPSSTLFLSLNYPVAWFHKRRRASPSPSFSFKDIDEMQIRAPEWLSGLRHCILVKEVSLQSLVWIQAELHPAVIGSPVGMHTIGQASSGFGRGRP